jgi:hypothetical protein
LLEEDALCKGDCPSTGQEILFRLCMKEVHERSIIDFLIFINRHGCPLFKSKFPVSGPCFRPRVKDYLYIRDAHPVARVIKSQDKTLVRNNP